MCDQTITQVHRSHNTGHITGHQQNSLVVIAQCLESVEWGKEIGR